MRYHKAHLTRRLILDTTTDSEKEENMVDMLREVGMPADFVNKLARMFQDIKVSQDLNQQFKEQCRATIADSINIKVTVYFFNFLIYICVCVIDIIYILVYIGIIYWYIKLVLNR